MEQTDTPASSKWSLAAKDGLILAAVSVVIMTLTIVTKNPFLSTLLWIVKLVGSIWVLRVVMRRYGQSNPEGGSTFSYGVIVCICSAIVCAVWTFVLYQYIFPDAVAEIFEETMVNLEQMGGVLGELPENFTDMMLRIEDNYAQIECITMFFWCSLLGLIISAILARNDGSGRKGNPFTAEEMKQGEDDGFNF